MNPELFFAFVLATAVMIVIPGPSVMLTVAHAMAFGAPKVYRVANTVFSLDDEVANHITVEIAPE